MSDITPGRSVGVELRLVGVTAAPGGASTVLDGLDLTLEAGSTTTLIGPSGAGKTTLLRVVAGLTPTVGGQVLLGDRDVTAVPAHLRRIGVVFQEPRLFPHLSVLDNVAFGLRAQGVATDERRERARTMLGRVGLAAVADRSVEGLSGGEQQRANLARALAVDPSVLLLDEPLAAVDPERRAELRELILELTAAPTCLHVTHDRAEAAELGDAVAVLSGGQIVQHGPPVEVFEHPATLEVAGLVGASNVLHGTVSAGRFALGDGSVEVGGPDGPAVIVVRPEQIALGTGALHGTIASSTYLGDATRVVVALPDGQQLTADVPVHGAPPAGGTISLDVSRAWRVPG